MAQREAPELALMQSKQVVMMWAAMTNNIHAHWGTILIQFALDNTITSVQCPMNSTSQLLMHT